MKVFMDQDFNVHVLYAGLSGTMINHEAVTVDAGGGTGMETGGEMTGGIPGDVPGGTAKDPLLSHWPFVIGISAATLAVSIVLGILLAKRKIKKGFELYED